MKLDLTKLGYRDLKALSAELPAAIARRKAEEASEVRAKLAKMASEAGFSLSDLAEDRPRRGKAKIKYRNPTDQAQTWTGRGRKPNWLVDKLSKGAKIEAFAA